MLREADVAGGVTPAGGVLVDAAQGYRSLITAESCRSPHSGVCTNNFLVRNIFSSHLRIVFKAYRIIVNI